MATKQIVGELKSQIPLR